jgi:cytochrome c
MVAQHRFKHIENGDMKSLCKITLVLFVLPLCACYKQQETKEHAIAQCGGDPDTGKFAIQQYGCGSCHTIPGIPGANGMVGPSLEKVAMRTYIAGVLPNNGTNIIRWILDPPSIDDKTAMPNVHVSPEDARNIATYLYTLK